MKWREIEGKENGNERAERRSADIGYTIDSVWVYLPDCRERAISCRNDPSETHSELF